jgi:hypothetical protein
MIKQENTPPPKTKTNTNKIKKNNDLNVDYEMYAFLKEHTTQGTLMAIDFFEEFLIKDLESAKKQEALTKDFKQGWVAAYMHILNNLGRIENNMSKLIPSYLSVDQFNLLFKRFQDAFPHKESA